MTRRAVGPSGALLLGLGLVLGTASVGCGADRGTIGALIAQTPDRRLVLREVPPNLAAARAGLQSGDEILLIDGRDVRELDPRGVHQALSGSVGDPVKLTLLRREGKLDRVVRVTLHRSPRPKKA
jgi:C-terminal processing protease CtpA/Prc